MPLKIGLTGGIAAGKSEALAAFGRLGAATLSSDAVVHELLEGEPLRGRLLQFDALAMRFRETRLAPDPHCPVCAPDRAFPGYVDYEAFCAGGSH